LVEPSETALFLSGMLSVMDHKPNISGRLGKELDTEAERNAARTAVLGALATAAFHLSLSNSLTH
jgi:hypothetical protein